MFRGSVAQQWSIAPYQTESPICEAGHPNRFDRDLRLHLPRTRRGTAPQTKKVIETSPGNERSPTAERPFARPGKGSSVHQRTSRKRRKPVLPEPKPARFARSTRRRSQTRAKADLRKLSQRTPGRVGKISPAEFGRIETWD